MITFIGDFFIVCLTPEILLQILPILNGPIYLNNSLAILSHLLVDVFGFYDSAVKAFSCVSVLDLTFVIILLLPSSFFVCPHRASLFALSLCVDDLCLRL